METPALGNTRASGYKMTSDMSTGSNMKKKLSIQTPSPHRTTIGSFTLSKKGRSSPDQDHNEYIRHTVHTYFDE